MTWDWSGKIQPTWRLLRKCLKSEPGCAQVACCLDAWVGHAVSGVLQPHAMRGMQMTMVLLLQI